jgi:3-oxoadipate enol-lactonase
MPTLTRPDYAINYQLEGPTGAPLLVLSNSLGAEVGMWDAQALEFSKRFRVLRYDNRGHGQSTASKGPYSIADVAGDAALLLEHLGESRAHFCGLSLGGMVGMWLATNRPQLIDKLILCNTSTLMGPRENWEARIAAVGQGGMRAVVKSVIERWFSERFRSTSPEIVGRIEQNFDEVLVEGYIGCCAAIRDMDQRQTISAIKSPTLVIGGTFDPSTPPAMCQYIAETIPGARYLELPTLHLSNVEAAPAFNQAVSQFLTS